MAIAEVRAAPECSPALDAFVYYLRFALRSQLIFEAVYPLPCPRCGNRGEGELERDGIAWWHCSACGANKGAAIASPIQAARVRARGLPRRDIPEALALIARFVERRIVP